MGVNDEHLWLALIRSLIRASLLIWNPTKAFCQGALPVMLQLETIYLLVLTAKILQLVLPAPAQLWAGGMGFLGTFQAQIWAHFRYKHQGILPSGDIISPLPLQIKPVVSQYLKQKKLPYNEDTYSSRLWLFLQRYEELMVHAPPITELVGIQ